MGKNKPNWDIYLDFISSNLNIFKKIITHQATEETAEHVTKLLLTPQRYA